MKSVVYHRLAASELIKSAKYYERRNSTLGDVFLSAVGATLLKIRQDPELGKPGKHKTRSWKIKRFPFRIICQEQPDRLWIVAITHLSRRPDYWIGRLR